MGANGIPSSGSANTNPAVPLHTRRSGSPAAPPGIQRGPEVVAEYTVRGGPPPVSPNLPNPQKASVGQAGGSTIPVQYSPEVGSPPHFGVAFPANTTNHEGPPHLFQLTQLGVREKQPTPAAEPPKVQGPPAAADFRFRALLHEESAIVRKPIVYTKQQINAAYNDCHQTLDEIKKEVCGDRGLDAKKADNFCEQLIEGSNATALEAVGFRALGASQGDICSDSPPKPPVAPNPTVQKGQVHVLRRITPTNGTGIRRSEDTAHSPRGIYLLDQARKYLDEHSWVRFEARQIFGLRSPVLVVKGVSQIPTYVAQACLKQGVQILPETHPFAKKLLATQPVQTFNVSDSTAPDQKISRSDLGVWGSAPVSDWSGDTGSASLFGERAVVGSQNPNEQVGATSNLPLAARVQGPVGNSVPVKPPVPVKPVPAF